MLSRTNFVVPRSPQVVDKICHKILKHFRFMIDFFSDLLRN